LSGCYSRFRRSRICSKDNATHQTKPTPQKIAGAA
jgi:hypothetical protein